MPTREHSPSKKDAEYDTRVSEKSVEDGGMEDHEQTHDDVFGSIKEGGPNYRNVGWLGTAVLMMKTQIGLGVLSIPSVLATLGVVPGTLCLLAVGIITTWSDWVVGEFKLRHPEIYSIDDAAFLMGGKWGREAISIVFWLFMTMVTGSGLLSVSIGLNAVSSHGACTAVFVAVSAILVFIFASIPTLGKISILGWIGLISILSAIFTLTIAVGVQDRPEAAPTTGNWLDEKEVSIVDSPSFYGAITAISSIVFSYAGTPAFFGVVSEMRDPKRYTRSLIFCQSVVTAVYLAIGIVVYFYCGQFVSSPALGSAGEQLKKVCYGLSLPGLIVTATIYSHLPAKWIFVRVLRGSEHLTANTFKHWAVWLSCTGGCVLFSYIVASAIPVFGGLVGLVGALLGTILCMQMMGGMYLFDHWSERKTNPSLRLKLHLGWAIFVVAIGTFLTVAGTYGSIVSIKESYDANGGSKPWSCADNS